MKKLILAVIAAAFFLTGCTKADLSVKKAEGLNITATIFPQYDFASQLAGEKASVTMLLPPGSESHTYEPSPQDIIKIQNSDLFIYTGGESDNWIDEILKTLDTDSMKIISLMDVCETVSEESVEGMQTEEHASEDEAHNADMVKQDEHVWTSPANAVKICDAIFNALCELDNENSEYYSENHNRYTSLLDEIDNDFKEIVSSSKRNLLVFGDRFPFRYFADRYGIEYFAAFPGCAEETEASISTVTFLIDKVKQEEIPVVLYPELSNHRLADTIVEETGAKALMLHSCHNVTREEFDSGTTYAELMKRNEEVLKEALN